MPSRGLARRAPECFRGGERLERDGWWLAPTVLEDVAADAEISCTELFGPVTILYRVRDLDGGARPSSTTRRTGSRAPFTRRACTERCALPRRREAGVVVVNGGTHGSEPHMGFGGVKQSGTGWREAGVEALDVYSEWKYVNLITDPAKA